MSTEKFRDRKFCMVLYPEDPTHVACIEKLQSEGYTFAAILHDKDTWTAEDEQKNPEHKAGELKKPHWHVVLKFPNAVWNEPTAKELGIAPNYLEKCRNLDGALVYLVHDGYDDKYQYGIEQVFGPLAVRLATLLADNDEGTRALNVYNIIRNSPGIVTYGEILEKAVKAGLYGDLRRMGQFATCLIREHNQEFYQESQSNAGISVSRDAFNEFLKWTNCKDFDSLPPF